MALVLQPEIGVPYSDDVPYTDLRKWAEAACNTAQMLEEHGLDLTATKEDEELAAKLALVYAENPETATKAVRSRAATAVPPASLESTKNILNEFGHSVVESAVQVRHLVTNKLLEETENPDPRVRIRALELLGKISDVGLFAEKSEVTITHQTTDELRERLRAKLERVINPPLEIAPATIIDGEVIDVDEELGLTANTSKGIGGTDE